MNLKDRMNSGLEIQKPQNSEIEPKNQSTLNDTTQKSNQSSLESLVEAQSEALRKLTAENHQKDMLIEDLRNQIQSSLSEKSELISVIAELRAENSSVQSVNQSIVKENDDLRNRGGLLSRKEQQKLAASLADTQSLLADTKKLVNMSNVEAVRNAQAAQEAAELKAKKDIADYKDLADGKINKAVEVKIEAKKNAKFMVDRAKKKERIAWESIATTLFCCLIAYPAFLNDLWDALTLPFMWVWNGINDYTYWLKIPYYSRYIGGATKFYAYSAGMAWLLRITSVILVIALIVGACYGIWISVQYYRKRWCNLSLKVLLISTGAVIVFGEGIHSLMKINLVALFIFIQLVYLGLLICFDDYFETRNKSCEWIQIQNR